MFKYHLGIGVLEKQLTVLLMPLTQQSYQKLKLSYVLRIREDALLMVTGRKNAVPWVVFE